MKKGEFGHRPECRKKTVKTQGDTGLSAGQGETPGTDSPSWARKEPALRHLPCERIHSCWSSCLLCGASSRPPQDTYKQTAVR